MTKFGSFLRAKRKQANLTQKGLSGQLNKKLGLPLDHSVISRWETGERSPGPGDRKILMGIANVLEMDEGETNEFLKTAGLSPLRTDEIDVKKHLASLPSEIKKVKFLHETMGWDEERIARELGLTRFQVVALVKAIKEATQELRAEPTWVAPFTAYLRNLLHVPYPTDLLVTDIKQGKVYVTGNTGGVVGCFYWEWDSKKEEPAVRLYQYEDDSILEHDPLFEKFLARRPEIRSLLDGYKEHGRRFVVSSKKLLDSLAEMARQMVGELLRRRGYDMGTEMRDPLARDMVFRKSHPDDPARLVLYRGFVDEAYKEILRQASDLVYKRRSSEKYQYKRLPVKENMCRLNLCSRLAEGPPDDIQELEQVHKNLVGELMTGHSALVEEVLKSGLKTWEISEQLRDQL